MQKVQFLPYRECEREKEGKGEEERRREGEGGIWIYSAANYEWGYGLGTQIHATSNAMFQRGNSFVKSFRTATEQGKLEKTVFFKYIAGNIWKMGYNLRVLVKLQLL